MRGEPAFEREHLDASPNTFVLSLEFGLMVSVHEQQKGWLELEEFLPQEPCAHFVGTGRALEHGFGHGLALLSLGGSHKACTSERGKIIRDAAIRLFLEGRERCRPAYGFENVRQRVHKNALAVCALAPQYGKALFRCAAGDAVSDEPLNI